MGGDSTLAAPPLLIRPTRGLASLNLRDLWRYRELLYFLVWRDLKVRYKQTALGVAWVALQPLAATAIFAIVFGRLVGVPSAGLPYPVFAFVGLVAWNYFAGAVTRAGTSLVGSSGLITKVYFPRLVIPISAVLVGLVDLAVGSVILVCLMLGYGITPQPTAAAVPLLVLLAMATALGVSLWLSALSVRFRDVNYVLPFLVQVWMYATPVVYPASLVPDRWRPLVGLNPMAGVVEGLRWSLTGTGNAPGPLMLVSIAVALALLSSGLVFFRASERTFADMI